MRLLVDDLNSAGTDDTLRAFSKERNVEVRLFNPFAMGRSFCASTLRRRTTPLTRVTSFHRESLMMRAAVTTVTARIPDVRAMTFLLRDICAFSRI